MTERPILFSGPMVRAILDGRKTQTRRVVAQVPHWQHCGRDIMDWGISGCYTEDDGRHWLDVQTDVDDATHDEIKCPYGQPGDRLWVRETWMEDYAGPERRALYRASWGNVPDAQRWRPSIHMPRWASRITLEVVAVRVERVQDITAKDAIVEGVTDWTMADPRVLYRRLWDAINAKRGSGWDANPWVWVIEFRRVEK